MTSFGAMRTSTIGLVKVTKATDKDRYLSYLPISHGMERWIGEVSDSLERGKHALFVFSIFFTFHADLLSNILSL